jgi:hypothetical protein
VACWRENEASDDDDQARQLLGAKTSSLEQGPRFVLVGTSQRVVVRENREAKCMMCWSGFSPVGCTPIRIITTLSDMSDRLPLQSSRSMFCYIDGMD